MRKTRWRILVFGLLFFLSMVIFPGMTEIRYSSAMEVQHQQIQQTKPNFVEQARAFYLAGDYQKAVEMWQKAVAEFTAQNQPLNQAMALSNLSLSYQKLGQWKQAEEAIVQSLNRLGVDPEFSSPTQLRLLAQILSIQGNFYLETGQPEKALSTWTEATEYYTKIGDHHSRTNSQINQAQAMQELGFYPKACQALMNALELSNTTCEWSSESQKKIEAKPVNIQNILAFRQLGEVFRVLGDFPASSQVLLTALEQAKVLQKTEQIGAVYLSLGKTNQAQGNSNFFNQERAAQDFNVALKSYTQAIESATQPLLQTQAKIETVNLLVQTQQWTNLQSLISEITAEVTDVPLSQSGINTQIRLI